MSDQNTSSPSTEMAPPVRVFVGFLQWVLGFALALPAGVMKAFPVTSALGSALMKPAIQLCFHGGHNFGRGIKGSFGMLGSKKSAEERTDDLHN